MPHIKAEYIWIDGQSPTGQLRSKTKILDKAVKTTADLPDWGFDGSSTEQAKGSFSDCQLKPVFFCPDPIRGTPHILVMCEVLHADGSIHRNNHRAALVEIAKKYKALDPWFGIEQEYTMYTRNGITPLGFPKVGFPAPQGPYYCGVGGENIVGRELVEAHMDACLAAGLTISGINAEVMPGQWEFQVGAVGPLEVADQLWLARWLLYRLGEEFGVYAKLDPKPAVARRA